MTNTFASKLLSQFTTATTASPTTETVRPLICVLSEETIERLLRNISSITFAVKLTDEQMHEFSMAFLRTAVLLVCMTFALLAALRLFWVVSEKCVDLINSSVVKLFKWASLASSFAVRGVVILIMLIIVLLYLYGTTVTMQLLDLVLDTKDAASSKSGRIFSAFVQKLYQLSE